MAKILIHRLNEDRLEELFWEFDTARKKSGDERGEFKKVMRQFAAESLDRAGVERDEL